jgi:hypothetical protein
MLSYIWFGGGQSQLINQAFLSIAFFGEELTSFYYLTNYPIIPDIRLVTE